jgi:hypothetical protein
MTTLETTGNVPLTIIEAGAIRPGFAQYRAARERLRERLMAHSEATQESQQDGG